MVQLFLIKFFILSFYHVLLKWLVYGDACGCEGKEAPWAVVKCIRTLPRTNRGKSPKCFGGTCLGLENSIRRPSEKVTYTSVSFCPSVTQFVTEFDHWKLPLCTALPATSLLYLTCVYVTVWQMALQVGTIFLPLSYIYVLFLFPGKKWEAISGRITCSVASGQTWVRRTRVSPSSRRVWVDHVGPRRVLLTWVHRQSKKCGMWT